MPAASRSNSFFSASTLGAAQRPSLQQTVGLEVAHDGARDVVVFAAEVAGAGGEQRGDSRRQQRRQWFLALSILT